MPVGSIARAICARRAGKLLDMLQEKKEEVPRTDVRVVASTAADQLARAWGVKAGRT